jgi:putative hemolysin
LSLIFLNGVFSGSEIAVLSLRKTRLQELLDAGKPGARAVARLREHPERFLAAVQIGITVVSATAAAFSGASLSARLSPVLAAIPGVGEAADPIAFGLVVAFVSFLSLVLGELVPKSLGLRYGETYALVIGRPLAWIARIATPAVWLLTSASNLVLRLFGDRTTFSEARLSREELTQLMDEAAIAGSLDVHAGEIATRALQFDTLDAADVMVSRRDIQAVRRDVTSAELASIANRNGHARVPVYGENLDDVLGVVNVREALGQVLATGALHLEAVLHPAPFVPESMSAPKLLRELQRLHSHVAIVVDERGTVRGLVTMEDLLEEMVGEIFSENDAPRPMTGVEADGSYVVEGGLAVHEANRDLELTLPESDEYSTVAGMCNALAGRIPSVGATLDVGELRIEVLEASARRVRRVRISQAGPSAEAPGGSLHDGARR